MASGGDGNENQILGQSAATAAVLAIEDGVAVRDLNYSRLRARLLADGQILEK